ncbi:DNA polymerase/3'-5' exonuclease PolX, partial [Candidatus Microgenomates bacterium]|nr:DNA polymerase/3'-5' exonuclease PolX [Candidatus Microgenomates bacterium]
VVPARSWGAALNYFTGSKDHNVGLRRLAVKKHLKLSEYGLFKGQKFLAGKIEEELYRRFGMDYIEPELREMRGEMEAAIAHKLPALIGYDDLKGDLQVQTNWTDGKASIEGMAKAAQAAGLDYLAITDHTKSLAMTKGLDDKRLLKQIKAIERINARLKGIRILKGSEVNIAKDGALDISNEVLSQLEVVGASIHSHFDLPPNAQTRRLIKAIESPNVDIIFHLTTRLLNRRKPIEFDFDEVLKAAKATGTVLEVNAYPDRLDIDDEQVKQAIESSIKLAIDSDAHAPMHFLYLKFGLAQARRGWATKNDVINSWPVDKMLKLLKGTAKKT